MACEHEKLETWNLKPQEDLNNSYFVIRIFYNYMY